MSFLLVDTGRYQQDSILHTLKEKFNAPLKFVNSCESALFHLSTHPKKPSTVIFNSTELRETVVPILKFLKKESPLTSSLLITHRNLKSALEEVETAQLIDHALFKPFLLADLDQALVRAFQKGVDKNNVIYLVSKTPVREVLFNTKLVRHEEPHAQLFNEVFRGVFIVTRDLDAETAFRWKRHLKNTSLPIGIYGLGHKSAWVLSSIGTSFYPETQTLGDCLKSFSERSSLHLKRILMTQALKKANEAKKYAAILKIAGEFEKLEPHSHLPALFSGNAYRLIGENENAVNAFQTSMKINPYYPENYIRLKMLGALDQNSIQQAKEFCFQHPEIRKW